MPKATHVPMYLNLSRKMSQFVVFMAYKSPHLLAVNIVLGIKRATPLQCLPFIARRVGGIDKAAPKLFTGKGLKSPPPFAGTVPLAISALAVAGTT